MDSKTLKKIILILLLISSVSFGQVYFTGNRYIAPTTAADSLITRMTTAGVTVTEARNTLIDNIFIMFLDSFGVESLQNKFDYLYFLDFGDSNASKINWAKNAHNLTSVGTVTWTDSGVVSDGSSSYLNTNYTASTQAVTYGVDNCSFGIYSMSNSTSANYFEMGFRNVSATIRTELNCRTSSGNRARFYINGADYVEIINTTSIGLYSISRIGTIDSAYQDGVYKAKTTQTVSGLPNDKIFLCAFNDAGSPAGYSPRVISFAFAGTGFTLTEMRKIYNIQQYWKANK